MANKTPIVQRFVRAVLIDADMSTITGRGFDPNGLQDLATKVMGTEVTIAGEGAGKIIKSWVEGRKVCVDIRMKKGLWL